MLIRFLFASVLMFEPALIGGLFPSEPGLEKASVSVSAFVEDRDGIELSLRRIGCSDVGSEVGHLVARRTGTGVFYTAQVEPGSYSLVASAEDASFSLTLPQLAFDFVAPPLPHSGEGKGLWYRSEDMADSAVFGSSEACEVAKRAEDQLEERLGRSASVLPLAARQTTSDVQVSLSGALPFVERVQALPERAGSHLRDARVWEGYVMSDRSLGPVSGARLSLVDPQLVLPVFTHSTRDGAFSVGFCSEDAKIEILMEGFLPAMVDCPDSGAIRQDVVLRSVGEIAVTVTDIKGRPVDGARVQLTGDAGLEQVLSTSSAGVVVFEKISPKQRVRIEAFLPGMRSAATEMVPDFSTSVDVSLVLGEPLSVRGWIVGRDDGVPIEDAEITATLSRRGRVPKSLVTSGHSSNADGSFETVLEDVAPVDGEVIRIDIARDGFIGVSFPLSLPAGASTMDLGEVALNSAPTLKVVVVDEDDLAVEGAQLELWSADQACASTDFSTVDGTAALYACTDARPLVLLAWSEGFSLETRTIDEVQEAVSVEMRRPVVLKGQVTSFAGDTIAGATVSVVPEGRTIPERSALRARGKRTESAATDPNGEFSVSTVTGPAKISAFHPDYQVFRGSLAVERDGLPVRVSLQSQESVLSGRVLGLLESGASVILRSKESNREYRSFLGPGGEFRFDGLADGNYVVRLRSSTANAEDRVTLVRPDDENWVELTAWAKPALSVELIGDWGREAISLTATNGSSVKRYDLVSSKLELTNLTPGTWLLELRTADQIVGEEYVVLQEGAEAAVAFHLEGL
ncbi:MAG: carboxypeptidase-like regulatory domain-containing protein [Acidobacteriota bacterium]